MSRSGSGIPDSDSPRIPDGGGIPARKGLSRQRLTASAWLRRHRQRVLGRSSLLVLVHDLACLPLERGGIQRVQWCEVPEEWQAAFRRWLPEGVGPEAIRGFWLVGQQPQPR